MDIDAQIIAIQEEIASATTKISYAGRSSESRTLDELFAILRFLRRQKSGEDQQSARRSAVASFDRGDC